MQIRTMEKIQDGFETRMPEGTSLNAANDPVIAGAGPTSAWDPFEIWRTRVRPKFTRIPREGKEPTA